MEARRENLNHKNPCCRRYGLGPKDRKCKDCEKVYVRETRAGARFYKCELRGDPTRGPGTDHRANWPACGQFVERKGDLQVYWIS